MIRRQLPLPARASGFFRYLTCAVAAGFVLIAMTASASALQQSPPDGAGVQPAATTAQPAPPQVYRSPRATLRTFLEAMNADPQDLDAAVGCMVLDGIVPEKAPFLAINLYRIFNRIEVVDLDADPTIPDATTLATDAWQGRTQWVYFPREPFAVGIDVFAKRRQFDSVEQRLGDAQIVLARQDNGAWKFSSETVAAVDNMWETVRDLDPVGDFAGVERQTVADYIRSWWPKTFIDTGFLGVQSWQWATLLLLILIGVVLDFTVRALLNATSRRIIARQGGRATTETLKRTVRPFGLTAAALFWLWTINLLDLPNDALKILSPAVKLFAMLTTVWSAFRVADLLSEVAASKAAHTDTKFDDLLIPLVRKTIKIFIFAFGLIYIAGALSIPLAPLLTGLGIGGAGFAFAAKDTLEHFFGSVTVIADRPFEVGDWVQINDTEGIVEEVGFRSTRVRTFYNSLVTIPNGNLVRAVVDNFGRRKYRRWSTHLTVTYDTPPDKIEAFCEGIREIIRHHPYTRKDYYQVWLHQFGAHSLDVLLYVFFESPDWNTELRERHRLCMDILRLADRLGVQFAFPTQTLHVFEEDANAPHDAAPTPGRDARQTAEAAGRQAFDELTRDAEWRTSKPGPYVFTRADNTPPVSVSTEPVDEEDTTQIETKRGGDAG